MRGYFAIGVEGLSKALNAANLFRTAHAFGARFVFTVGATLTAREAMLDTSRTIESVPYYPWQSVEDMQLPKGCKLVGVELVEGATDLPSFHHPRAAAYVLGAERGTLSPALLERASHVVRIPTAFCVNVAVAGAIVMYDRLLSQARFAERPFLPGAAAVRRARTPYGRPITRRKD
jgi:tRNA G18 (ribose-2'-O)-methylase SpoU